jgi:hypothetical protein
MTTHTSTPAFTHSINQSIGRSAAGVASALRAFGQSLVRRIRTSWREGVAMDSEFDRRREEARQMFYAQSGGRG